MILFVVFVVYPVLMAIWYSFTDYNVLEKANFIGFDNYRKLFLDDDTFITAIKNTFIIAVIVGPGGYVLSFLLAWMINELPHKLGVVLTVIFYAPSMAGTAVVAVFRQIFSDDASGYLNAILRNLGHHQGSYFMAVRFQICYACCCSGIFVDEPWCWIPFLRSRYQGCR